MGVEAGRPLLLALFAEALVDERGRPVPALDRRLRDYSLVEHEPGDDRYYLLAPVRHFARRHLPEKSRQAVAKRAGSAFGAFARFLYENWPRLGGGVAATLFTRDEANLHTAIEMCRRVSPEQPRTSSPSLAIATYLISLYNAFHQLEAGHRLSASILKDGSWATDPVGLASVHLASGDLARRRDQLDQADTHYQAAEALFRQIEDALGLANTLKAKGDLAKQRGDLVGALEIYHASVLLYAACEDMLGLSNVLSEVAEVHVRAGAARRQSKSSGGHSSSQRHRRTDTRGRNVSVSSRTSESILKTSSKGFRSPSPPQVLRPPEATLSFVALSDGRLQ